MVDINETWGQELLNQRVADTMNRIVEEGWGVSMRRGSLPEVASDIMKADATVRGMAGGSQEGVTRAIRAWRQARGGDLLCKAAAGLSGNERQQPFSKTTAISFRRPNMSMDPRHVVAAIVEPLFQDPHRTTGVLVTLDCRASCFDSPSGKMVLKGSFAHLLFAPIRYGDQTASHPMVFFCGNDKPDLDDIPSEAWVFVSAHDSCWSDLSILSTVELDLQVAIANSYPRVQRDAVWPKINSNTRFHGEPLREVVVTTACDPFDRIGYRRVVTHVAFPSSRG